MKTINYNKEGESVSDYKIKEWVDNFINSDDSHASISTAMIIDEIRARIKEGKIDCGAIRIIVDGSPFRIDKDGRSNDWHQFPQLEVFESILMRLI